jgi:hypothetical protein
VPFLQQLVSLFRLTHLHRIAFPLLQNGTNDFRRGKEVLLFSRVKASTALATATKCTLKRSNYMQGQAKPPLWILSWTMRCTDWYMGGVALSGLRIGCERQGQSKRAAG